MEPSSEKEQQIHTRARKNTVFGENPLQSSEPKENETSITKYPFHRFKRFPEEIQSSFSFFFFWKAEMINLLRNTQFVVENDEKIDEEKKVVETITKLSETADFLQRQMQQNSKKQAKVKSLIEGIIRKASIVETVEEMKQLNETLASSEIESESLLKQENDFKLQLNETLKNWRKMVIDHLLGTLQNGGKSHLRK